ncbi:hypothetical protein SAMN06265337_2285 [Hymenobacter gelipurpurascens]|uniref:Uncharacterized protein n=1 Tax=Hymenobacter gelipurpurascens TaxID=89968 RepID=A0A212TQU5_9BACT|nr:hypothetical protein [Hymenobacter gelipurpurascens]SNC68379.1 hypothetical protein SAMN06265337_2285 [Hymenobacter gelipurpurascens]
MDTPRTFSADTEAALWQQVAADMAQEPDLLEYTANLQQNGHTIQLDIDIDMGGGFEGGYETTTFTAVVPRPVALRFALHEQDWIHELGKLLGLTDVELGYPELDAAYIITTNDKEALRALFSDPAIQQTLLKYQEMRLTLAPSHHEDDSELYLTFLKEQAILEPEQLQEIYHLLYTLLQQLAPTSVAAVPLSNLQA